MPTLRERFEAKFYITPGCWIWTACRNKPGYGMIFAGCKGDPAKLAHRVSYELYEGAIPDGLMVLHRCDNPSCVNPSHLFLGTNDDNMKDMAAKGRASRMLGNKNPKTKIKEEDLILIKQAYKLGIHPRTLAEAFGVAREHIYGIIAGRFRGTTS